jgi:Fic family protein|tara:strand:- start:66 stop:860 length:795 start_codon:yes stop_codon:yes gene_type:complete
MNKIETTAGYIVSLDEFLKGSDKDQKEFLEDFVAESNWIEGIEFNKIVTMNKGDKIKPYYKVTDHKKALDYVLDNYKEQPTEQDIKHLHRLLTENIFREEAEYIIDNNKLTEKRQKEIEEIYERDSGNYRQCKVWVGLQGGTYYRQVPKLMKGLEKDIKQLTNPTEQDVWTIHNKFETFHPFVDGNGRTGRLLLNWLSLRYLNEFIINQGDKRGDYYDIIREYTAKFKQENSQVHFYKDLPPRKIDEHQIYELLLRANEKPFFD